jgi:hypothetical protein
MTLNKFYINIFYNYDYNDKWNANNSNNIWRDGVYVCEDSAKIFGSELKECRICEVPAYFYG